MFYFSGANIVSYFNYSTLHTVETEKIKLTHKNEATSAGNEQKV